MRTRLTTEQRRAQLLEVGIEVFASKPYEQVSIEYIADVAGVSHGLLYRYFPSKQAFFTAVVEVQGKSLLDEAGLPDSQLSPLDQIRAGIEVYITQAERSPSAYRMAHQIGISDHDTESSKQARNIIQRDRVLDSLAALTSIDAETGLAVTSWLGFTQTAILGWIDNPNISRHQLLELCMRALLGAVNIRT